MKNLHRQLVLLLVVCLGFVACAGPGGSEAQAEGQATNSTEVSLDTEEQKVFYAMGTAMARQLVPLKATPEELAALQAGLEDVVQGREAKVEFTEYLPKIQAMTQERMAAAASAEAQESEAFLADAAKAEGVVTTDSGLLIETLTEGSGEAPSAESTVKVHYHGTLRNGQVFDSSVDRGEPVSFQLNQVVPCWQEGLKTMKPGGKSRLTCPPALAYGAQGAPPQIPPNAVLIFEVELLSIE